VEPFCGACAVLLAKERAKLEVINDADGDMVTFYRYVQHHPEALKTEMRRWTGNSRANFEALLRNPGFTDLQRAARWFILKVASFGAKSETWGRIRDSFYGYDPNRQGDLIDQLRTRLERVMIESGDWERVVEFYDAQDTFFFFDPPYVDCGATAYAPFTPEQMVRVRRRLDKLQGKWLLTCDDSAECRDIFAGLPVQPMSIRYSIGQWSGNSKESGELLVFHPDLAPKTATVLKFARKKSRLARTA
jgi:DNA adenine methylase